MRHILLLLFLCCTLPAGPRLPDLELSADTLLLREHIGRRGAERTGNWWFRFDRRGCYTEDHNTWLWVHDPLLQRSTSRQLYFNTLPPGPPWFCLSDPQRARLEAAVRQVLASPVQSDAPPPGLVDRWTVAWAGRSTSVVIPVGGDPGAMSPVTHIVEDLAREGVWGQSPEPDPSAWATATESAIAALP
jgi:hypothetical protein